MGWTTVRRQAINNETDTEMDKRNAFKRQTKIYIWMDDEWLNCQHDLYAMT